MVSSNSEALLFIPAEVDHAALERWIAVDSRVLLPTNRCIHLQSPSIGQIRHGQINRMPSPGLCSHVSQQRSKPLRHGIPEVLAEKARKHAMTGVKEFNETKPA